jgi:hypothetical protein
MGTPSAAFLEIFDLRLLWLEGCLFQLGICSFEGSFAILVIFKQHNMKLSDRRLLLTDGLDFALVLLCEEISNLLFCVAFHNVKSS